MAKLIDLMTKLAVAKALSKCESIPFQPRAGYNRIRHKKHKRGRPK